MDQKYFENYQINMTNKLINGINVVPIKKK